MSTLAFWSTAGVCQSENVSELRRTLLFWYCNCHNLAGEQTLNTYIKMEAIPIDTIDTVA